MGYENALKCAGAEVHKFADFGSYQGDWWAKVTYEGNTGWINGSYGSCSGCDAFQSEFDYTSHECDGTRRWPGDSNFNENCEDCQNTKTRLTAFGKEYLSRIYTQEEAEKEANRNIDWDSDAKEMVEFIKENA